jgi:hypothetical protein
MKHREGSDLKIGLIDYYLDEWHANNYPAMIRKASGGKMEAVYAYAMIDSPIGGRATDSWCREMNIARIHTIEEIIEKSDALIVLSPDNCEMHETLCRLPLSSGKRTYVDKTFAPDGITARRILAVAEKSNTPCYSTSALRFALEYAGIDVPSIQAVSAWGPGSFKTYAIHQLEPVMMLMKARVEKVMASCNDGWTNLTIAFGDGRHATISCFEAGAPFSMNLCMRGGNRVVTVESDFFQAFINELCLFFETGRIPVSHEDTLSIMDVRGAGIMALKTPDVWVSL